MSHRYQIVFRLDCSVSIGTGHLYRCLTLARELQGLKCQVRFVMRQADGNLVAKIVESGVEARFFQIDQLRDVKSDLDTGPLSEQMQLNDAKLTLGLLDDWSPNWIIVDHYGLGAVWEKELRNTGAKICVLDDLANRNHVCDVLLDANYVEPGHQCRYDGLVPSNCRKLIGTSYALLNPHYALMQKLLPDADGLVRRVFVFFGGTDSSNLSSKVLEALSAPKLAHLVIDMVLGSNFMHREQVIALAASRGNVNVHHNLQSLAGLMARADLAIGAGGIATWERMCLGVPSLIAIVAPNQERVISALTIRGYVASLAAGKSASCEEWGKTVSALISDRDKLVSMVEKSRNMVDGMGARCVAHLLLTSELDKIALRTARLEDEDLLLKWANDLDVRRQSFTTSRITKEQHSEWLREKLVSSDCFFLIAESEVGLPIGQVRFDIDFIKQQALIDVSIDVRLRRSGVGKKLLREALVVFKTQFPSINFLAEVLEGNFASQRLFAGLGFLTTQKSRVGTTAWVLSKID
jgi:UDP-2,4-diacetamido-2,4,6-trideoxy-beta-L-altropyranose hydrolase